MTVGRPVGARVTLEVRASEVPGRTKSPRLGGRRAGVGRTVVGLRATDLCTGTGRCAG